MKYLALLALFIVWAPFAHAAQAERTLRWIDNSDDENAEDGCIIEAQRGNSGWFEIGRVGPNQDNFDLVVQRNECYRVRCFNQWGISPPSNVVCGRSYV